ncbi:cyclic nucleotide-binding domain-containing protein [Rhizobiales bacterium]|uniref:cyclic nucleotide-binding domain-containing protein n=1 Tax=Hongsoonwoonella zoysiae TaxID=2821844 RepID=UPI00155F79DD|nr:adenylate/guanylate cyclase domain-containing protein [Hongsoonwoonella zoysiae]NRG18688.1 cyclic nucleotide-binding domain-containing protein [Hongsoonwoonella zoysiae]
MTKKPEPHPLETLGREYIEAMIASGLVDDIADCSDLVPRPYRYAEGEYICRHGDVAECLWVIVTGSVAVKEGDRTLFVRRRGEVVGEQNLLGNGYRRMYDLVASEMNVEVLVVDKASIEKHPERDLIYRNIARIISLKLKNASIKVASLSRQLQDDTRILHAYTNQYALSRRMQAGGGRLTDYKVDRAIIWFSDVVGFSEHTLSMSPERTADIVQRFFNAQSVPIAAHGGYIDKFIGDGLMAFWVLQDGASTAKACLESLRAAENAVKAVSEIRIGNARLHLRIGLHLGLALSGDFGSATRHQFTLIGKDVNKAARLEEVHKEDIVDGDPAPGDIRISTEFRAELSDTVQQRYTRRSIARAKNIGEIELYS